MGRGEVVGVLGNAGNAAALSMFLMTDDRWLRVAALACNLIFVLYFLGQPEIDQAPAAWNLVFGVINARQLHRALSIDARERFAAQARDLRSLFKAGFAPFGVRASDYMALSRTAEWREFEKGDTLVAADNGGGEECAVEFDDGDDADAGEAEAEAAGLILPRALLRVAQPPPKPLILVARGRVRVENDGRHAGAHVASTAGRALIWSAPALRAVLRSSPSLRRGFGAAFERGDAIVDGDCELLAQFMQQPDPAADDAGASDPSTSTSTPLAV
jgi:hypothetical protein